MTEHLSSLSYSLPAGSSAAGWHSPYIAIVGAGHVGCHVASALMMQGLAGELSLIDIDEAKAAAHARDLNDASAYMGQRVRVQAAGLDVLAHADIVIVAASGPIFKEDRLEELQDNIAVMDQLIPAFRTVRGHLVSITNPCDVIAWYLQTRLQRPVIGTGTLLDSARLQAAIATETGWDARSVQAYCLGEHGDSQIVAWDAVTIGGKPLNALLKEQPAWLKQLNMPAIAYEVMKAGWNIVLGKGSTEFGIGAAAARLVRALLWDEHAVLPVSSLWQGEYGESPVFASTPSVIGAGGVLQRMELSLNDSELDALHQSCGVIRDAFGTIMESSVQS